MKSKNKLIRGLTFGIGISIVLISGSFISCEKANISPVGLYKKQELKNVINPAEMCSPLITKTLTIGGKIKVGYVEIYNDAHYLYVNAFADAPYGFGEGHLYAGNNKDIPRNRLGVLDYRSFNYIKYRQARQYLNTMRFKVLLSDVDPNVVMAMMIQVSAADRTGEIQNAWMSGDIVETRGDGQLLEFETVRCSIGNLDPNQK